MTLDELVIIFRMTTENVEQKINQLNEKLEQIGNTATQSGKKSDLAMAAMATAATAAFYAIGRAISSTIGDFKQYQSALSGLSSIAKYTKTDTEALTEAIKELTADGLITMQDAAASYKNLLLYGYSIQQAADMLMRLKDSAAYGRQAHYGLSEAVRVTTDGIRQEISQLADAAGVTKNIAKMQEEYARSIGKSYTSLTQAEKAQAVYLGIMKETEPVVGNAAKAAEEFAGQQNKLYNAQLELNAAYGEAMSSALTLFLRLLTPIVSSLSEFVKQNQGLVSGLTMFIVTSAGVVVAYNTIKKALEMLGISMLTASGKTSVLIGVLNALKAAFISNPIGWIALALGAVVGAISWYSAETEKAAQKEREWADAVKARNDALKDGISLEEKSTYEVQAKKLEEYIATLKQYERLREEIASGTSLRADAYLSKGLTSKVKELEKQIRDLGIEIKINTGNTADFKENIDDLSRELETLRGKLQAVTRLSLDQFNAQRSSLFELARTSVELQNQLEILKTSKQGSKEYANALEKVASVYPEIVKNGKVQQGIIDSLVDKEQKILALKLAQLKVDAKEQINALKERNRLLEDSAKTESTRGGKARYEMRKELTENNALIAEFGDLAKLNIKDLMDYGKIFSGTAETVKSDIADLRKESAKKISDALTEAIRKQYETELAYIEKVNRAKQEAIDKEIAALDDLLAKRRQDKEDADLQQKINETAAQLNFELDESNRKNIRAELDRLLAEQADRAFEQSVENEKKRLEGVKDQLSKELESWQEFYNKKTEEAAIQAEKEKLINQKSQKALIDYISKYAGSSFEDVSSTVVDTLVKKYGNAVSKIPEQIAQAYNKALASLVPALPPSASQTSTTYNSKSYAPTVIVNSNIASADPDKILRALGIDYYLNGG